MLGRAVPTTALKIKYKIFSPFFIFSQYSLFFSENLFSNQKEEHPKKLLLLRVSWNQPTKFGKFILNRFWGVLCQPVYLESNIRHSRSFSLFNSRLWFFLKTHLQVRKGNLKIIFAPFLVSLGVSQASLVNLYLTDFGACSANQCTQNQIKDNHAVFLWLTALLGFFSKLAFELERVTAK